MEPPEDPSSDWIPEAEPPAKKPKKPKKSKAKEPECASPSSDHIGLYSILEVSSNATADEIRKAYKKRSLVLHPDKPTGSNEAFPEALPGPEHPQRPWTAQVVQHGSYSPLPCA